MTRKVLFTASTDIHLISFHTPYLNWFRKRGFETHVACNGDRPIAHADKVFKLPFNRNPLSRDNIKTYHELKRIIDENNYNIIHCHTPACGVITRLASINARRTGTQVLYTAHGFHFYKGAGIKNWLTYFPVELALAPISDGIITINDEDYKRLQSKWFRSKRKYHIDGIGINPARLNFNPEERNEVRKSYNIGEEDIVFFYIAEFNARKNHAFIFNSIRDIINENKNVKFMFAGGSSTEKEKMVEIATIEGFMEHLIFLGFQDSIGKFIAAADVGISSSKAEGLPIGISEMMYHELPVLASTIRGHIELIQPGYNGFLFKLDDPKTFQKLVLELASDKEMRKSSGMNARKYIEKYLIHNSLKQMASIYNDHI